MKNRARNDRSAGFTMIEVLVALVIMLILLLLAAPPLFTTMRQGKIRGIASETVALMRLARMDAIRHSAQGIVEVVPGDPDAGQYAAVRAFSDRNSNGVRDEGEPEIGRHLLPNRVEHRSPGGGPSVSGFVLSGGRAIFLNNGAVVDRGAFRFADDHDNFLEVAVVSTTGRIEVRKCRLCEDDDPENKDWYAQGEGWTWEWN
jgi:prepilin-type N-terminal cleavage/methylation domain-containing protein